ncbi:hypothetical protein AAES_34698 [Amazona aestiva]|nr:hypothetical protein AAES_34698 [Amazona aestiva]
MWEPRAAEPQPQGDEGGAAPSPQSPEDGTVPGVLGSSPRPRISLCAVMRSISQLEPPEPPELPEEPLSEKVFAAAEAPAGSGGSPTAASPRARPSSRPRWVPRQCSLDGGPAPEDGGSAHGHAPTGR